MVTIKRLDAARQSWVIALGVLAGVSALAAQLPPAIEVDRLLQRAEREIAAGDHAMAAESLNGAEVLQAQHDLDLPVEFWFKKAQVLLEAGSYTEALEAVTTYLVTAGQDSEHYLPALELFDRAEGGKSRSEQAAQASALDEQLAANCTGWRGSTRAEGTPFKPSTVGEAVACLEAGGASLRDDGGATLLHLVAANVDDPAVIEHLVVAGMDVEARALPGRTLVQRAVAAASSAAVRASDHGAYEIVKLLSGMREDLAAFGEHRVSPFFAAAHSGHPEVVGFLRRTGADLEERRQYGSTPLQFAAAYNDSPEVIGGLLKAGSDVAVRGWGDTTLLHVAAARNRNPEVVTFLRSAGIEYEKTDQLGATALHHAAANKNGDVLELLLAAGLDPNRADSRGWRPLHYAATYNDNPAVVEALLRAGAQIRARTLTEGQYTALHLAAMHSRSWGIVEALLEAGADLEAWTLVEYNWETPYTSALFPGGKEKSATHGTETPLHLAAKHNEDSAILQFLLDQGADPRTRVLGEVKMAGEGKQGALGRWWKSTALHLAAGFNGNPEIVDLLVQAGIDVDAGKKWFFSPLHAAARFNAEPGVAGALLDAGADVNAGWYDGKPLHEAVAWNRNPAVAELLLSAGADVNARDEYKCTPLHSAARFAENPEVVELLLRAGADLTARCNKETPVELAVREESPLVGLFRQAALREPAGSATGSSKRRGRWGKVATAVLGGAAIATAGDGSDAALESALGFAGEVLGSGNPVSVPAEGLAGTDSLAGAPGASVPEGVPGCQEFSATGLENDRQAWAHCGNAYANTCRIKQISDPEYRESYPEVTEAQIEQAVAQSRAIISRSCEAIRVTGSSPSDCSYCR